LEQWSGRLERATPESLFVRPVGADTLAPFSRVSVDALERARRGRNPLLIGGFTCAAVGSVLAVLGSAIDLREGPPSSDLPGRTRWRGARVGFALGCGLGFLVGAVNADKHTRWEPWQVP
jgi:hypothetical protein